MNHGMLGDSPQRTEGAPLARRFSTSSMGGCPGRGAVEVDGLGSCLFDLRGESGSSGSPSSSNR